MTNNRKTLLDRLKGLVAPAAVKNPPAHADADRIEPGGLDAPGILVNAYCTKETLPKLPFAHRLNLRRGLDDAELAPHLQGFIGYVLGRGDGTMTRTRYHLMRHLQRVRQHLSLSLHEAQLDAFSVWAEEANAIVFLPDGGIRDPNGRVLLTAAGEEPDPQAAVPYPAEAWQRKARTEAFLASRGFSVPTHLPPLVSEPELQLRDADEIAERMLALWVVAVRAEALDSGEAEDPLDALRARSPDAFAHLTPKEQAFVADPSPSPETVTQFGWRYECLWLLEWTLGLVDALPFPDAICDVPVAVRTAMALDVAQALKLARPRAAAELLDALDLHYRLHWLVHEEQVRPRGLLKGIEPGVVQERHHALNWLVRSEDADWDAVDTPT